MANCIKCGKSDASLIVYHKGHVCSKCAEDMFTCPDCGMVFEWDDIESGDEDGFCANCAENFGKK